MNRKLAELSETKKNLLLIFGIALSCRVVVGAFQTVHGISPIPWIPYVNTWSDFYSVYGQQLGYLSQGLQPYTGFAYTYTPLFLYSLYPFYFLGGIAAGAIPILLADSATAVLIFLYVGKMSSNKVAMLAGLAYAVSPFALINEGYLWLSSQPMFFFMMMALYMLRQNKPLQSSVFFAVAVLFKQEAIFALPVYAVWYVAKYKTIAWKGVLVFLGTILVVSLPFLIMSYRAYIDSVTYDTLYRFLPVSTTYPISILETINSTVQSATCSLIGTKLVVISSCHFGYVTYSIDPVISILDRASGVVLLPELVLVALALIFQRRRSNMLELGCAYSSVVFLSFFSILIHVLLTYYFLPVYGLLFASSRNLKTVGIVSTTTVISLLTPTGAFQAILPLLTITAILTTKDNHHNISEPLRELSRKTIE